MKKQKILIFLLFFIIVGLAFISPPSVQAASDSQGPCANTDTLGLCVVSIYRWALGIAVLLALTMIIFSGYYYMTAGGDAQKVQSAKDMFANAFIGLIILFSAVLILRTINPDLVRFKADGPAGGAFLAPAHPDVAGSFDVQGLPRG